MNLLENSRTTLGIGFGALLLNLFFLQWAGQFEVASTILGVICLVAGLLIRIIFVFSGEDDPSSLPKNE